MAQKTILIITDGIGSNKNGKFNAFEAAKKPNYEKFFKEIPNSLIKTSGNAVGLPERQMGAGRLFSMSGFTKGPLGLRNLPAPYTMIAPEDLDLVLVPAVACGVDGTRLGMGAGYYDRYLERVSLEKRVSVLWDFQVMDSVPNGIYDKYISKIVTEKRIIITKRG